MLSTTEIIIMHTPTMLLDTCKRWGSHNALDDLVLDLYLRGPEDDLKESKHVALDLCIFVLLIHFCVRPIRF